LSRKFAKIFLYTVKGDDPHKKFNIKNFSVFSLIFWTFYLLFFNLHAYKSDPGIFTIENIYKNINFLIF